MRVRVLYRPTLVGAGQVVDPPRQIPTLVTLGDRRETQRSQALGPNTDNLVQLSISTRAGALR